MAGDLANLVEMAGVTPSGAQVLVGNLILENARYEFAFRQLRKLHRRENSIACTCGKALTNCQSYAVIKTFDEYEKAVQS